MPQKAPGKHYRVGLSWIEVMDLFPDDAAAERWIVQARWPDEIACVHCGSLNVATKTKHPRMPFRCRDCRKYFSAKTGTPMESSNLGYRVWAIALFLMTTGLKGTASMKMHRDLHTTQKTAWHLAHRIRESWDRQQSRYAGPVEADETYVGGLEKNKPKGKRLNAGRGAVGKTAVAGLKDRATNRVTAAVVQRTDGPTLRGFVEERTEKGAKVYTDEASAYQGLENHETVRHSVGQYVNGEASTNGLESFWSLLKRGYHGTFHHMSPEHLDRYVTEFAGRHNDRPLDTLEQMARMVRGLEGKRLRYRDLIDHGHGQQAAAT